ncbi:MAG TPA: Glu/Leu/Phe/Val dehydrogenase [Gaiellales bacterium]|nr:Glu/Leu/Phe/Val dehydrogenase [Gaiellales bacterium]
MRLFADHEQIVVCQDRASGLRAIIAVHDTTLGPGLGGIRMWTYQSDEAALTDVLRLSEGMTYKNALAGLDLGGGKTVVLGNPRTDKTPEKFQALGRFIDRLGGAYLAAEDVGTTTEDAEQVATQTRYITGLPVERGGSGDPSPMTAWGVFRGIRAALVEAGLGGGYGGVRVAVQGAGHVGADVARHLLDAGAEVTVADIHDDRVAPLAEAGAAVVPADEIHTVECEVYCPCALGAVIRPETIGRLRCRVVAGAANNQLADASMGDELKRRGIVYAPDFAINAGGVINIGDELIGDGYDADRARRSVERIEQTLAEVFERARRDGVAPARAAEQMARERIAAARSSAVR